MAVKTDGYITSTSSGDWRFSNTGQGTRGDVQDGDVNSDAYIRLERQAGAVAGTKVDALGAISAGPVIDFTSLGSLLAGAPSAPGAPFVVWAGVSPLSLSEVLIVWNQPIVILDRAKILGGDTVSVAGRLMVVGLAEPIAIDGEEQATVTLQPGAVGVYGQEGALCAVDGAPANITQSEPSGELEPLPDVEAPCDCYTPLVVSSESEAASGTGAQVLDARLFAEQLCQDGGCDPPAELVDQLLSFTVNNQLRVPVRCCHPFYLFKLSMHGDDGDCPCIPCPVWFASLMIYGSTMPGEVLPLDQLFEITDPCRMWDEIDGSGVPAILNQDASCCANITVTIVGNLGPPATVLGRWNGRLPGLSGQSCYIVFKKEENCAGVQCETNIYPDSDADPWVEEAILKPRYRPLPVSFFEPLAFSTLHIDIPPSIITTQQEVVTACNGVELQTAIVTGIAAISSSFVAATPTGIGKWFETCTGTSIDVCVSGSMTSLFVITNCTGQEVVNAGASLVTPSAPVTVLTNATPVTVVTTCQDMNLNYLAGAAPPKSFDILVLDEEGEVKLPKATTPDCARTWKFVMHNGTPQQWTQIGIDVPLPCGPDFGCDAGRFCQFTTPPHPAEVNCVAVNLTTPIWVSRSETLGSDGGCPGYDCSPENPPVPPMGSDVPNGPGGPVACGILIRRPQRRPFVMCKSS